MAIYIRVKRSKTTYFLQCDPTETILDIKQKLHTLSDQPVNDQRLILVGTGDVLVDSKSLADQKVENDAVVALTLRKDDNEFEEVSIVRSDDFSRDTDGFSNCSLQVTVVYVKVILENYGEEKDKARCDCCNEIVIDYAYTLSYGACVICLDCFFTPSKPGFSLHEHPMNLELLVNDTFLCGACGSVCKQKLHYGCTIEGCSFKLGVKCGLLEETVPFDRHRHSFHLIISPDHISNQYYCEVCQEERDKNHWVYCCVECDYFIHVRCLVPTGGCAPLDT